MHPQDTDDYVIQEIPMPAIDKNPIGEERMSDFTDFEELKRQRMEKKKNKLVACLKAIRNNKESDDSKIVEELVRYKLK